MYNIWFLKKKTEIKFWTYEFSWKNLGQYFRRFVNPQVHWNTQNAVSTSTCMYLYHWNRFVKDTYSYIRMYIHLMDQHWPQLRKKKNPITTHNFDYMIDKCITSIVCQLQVNNSYLLCILLKLTGRICVIPDVSHYLVDVLVIS